MKTTVMKEIPIPYTPEELNVIGRQHAEVCAKISDLREQKKAEAKRIDGEIASLEMDELQLRRARLAEIHYELRECVVEYDLTRNMKLYVLVESSEVVHEEPIMPGEQLPIDAVNELVTAGADA